MRRRAFLGAIAMGALACPGTVLAQPRRKRLVGFLHPGNSATVPQRIVAFREGIAGAAPTGFDIEVILRIGNDRLDLLPAMAAELVTLGVEAICAVSPPPLEAARQASRSVPIVAMDLESDPVARGWAKSLARPGGNVTGIFLDLPDFSAKCLDLLREAVPGMRKVAVLWHPASGDLHKQAVEAAAASLGIPLEVFAVGSVAEFEPAFRAIAASGAEGILMLSSPLFGGNPQPLAELTLVHRLPAINLFPEFAARGGLIGYGPDLQELFAQAGALTRKILDGASPAELPVERPSRFKLVANMRTARTMNLALPTSILLRADEVIE
jgi:putative ABC transport system substrate-binding protein